MITSLSHAELKRLVQTVFAPTPPDRTIAFLVDVPNARVPDHPAWQERRALAVEWQTRLQSQVRDLGLENVGLFYYENVGSNNADLPAHAYTWPGGPSEATCERLEREGAAWNLEEVLAESDIVFALTEFSATAPLKVLARRHGFRAASMPGFNREMVPALRVDFEEVHRRVVEIKTRLDRAEALRIRFEANGKGYEFSADLRYRNAYASSGLLRERGTAGNLPSGESYIVPYEGERGEPSGTAGVLPVQFHDEIVLYRVEQNRAVQVLSSGAKSEAEQKRLQAEPAYGNIAEIGFGVLRAFGVQPVGEILLDEKLGLHVAFGRSDHFGGATYPSDFSAPEHVVHIDRIFIPEVQPRVRVLEVTCVYPESGRETLMRVGEYVRLRA